MLVLVVGTGATVRLTGSGLGCEHWPGCSPHHFEPRSFHSDVEFGNRIVAFFTIIATLVTFVGAVRARLSPRLRLLALATFVGTLLQAPLGVGRPRPARVADDDRRGAVPNRPSLVAGARARHGRGHGLGRVHRLRRATLALGHRMSR